MKIQNNLNKEIQLARLYRSVAVLFELATIYAVGWVIVDIISWIAKWI